MSSTTVGCPRRADVVELVGRRMREVVVPEDPALTLLDYVLASKGKMLRAYLVFLTSSLWEAAPSAAVLDVAAGVELVHLASLIHDDIIDESERRRGLLAVHRAFGVKEAVLLGDYLFAAAFGLFTHADEEITAIISAAIREMSIGEIGQLLRPGRDFQQYWRYIHRKTAALLGACCQAGAMLAGQGPVWGPVLRDFGEALGLAFQLTDDVLDYRGSSTRLGKTVGEDFAAQAWTLPIILATSRAVLDDRWSSLDFSHVQAVLDESGILDEVWQLARECLHRAGTVLAQLPDSEALRHLRALLDELAVRQA
ncbi:MAG: polyprenyl synthetase family protein [Limnochordia bacterium]